MNAFWREKIKNRQVFFLPLGRCFLVFLFIVIVISGSPGRMLAAEKDKGANSEDIYIVQGKVTVVYKDCAPDAGEDPSGDKKDLMHPGTGDEELSGSANAVTIESDTMSYDHVSDVYHASGRVKIFYSGSALYADDVQLYKKDNLATADGNALLKMGEDTLRGEKMVVNIQDKTGTAYHADAFYAKNHFYVRGDKIEKTGESSYVIEKPAATTCDGNDADWQITGEKMNVTMEGYGSIKNACFLAKGIPLLYTPYILFPAKTKRQTGFLLPYVSYSRDKDGMDVEIPFFWAISDQMDATYYPRYIENRGFKQGLEFRYYWGESSFGTFYGDYLEDDLAVTEITGSAMNRDWNEMHKRWSYYFNHETNFSPDFYMRADLKKVSDKWYFKDFSSHNYFADHYTREPDGNFKNVSFWGDESLRYLESTFRVFKGWSNYSLTGIINSTEDFGAVNNDRTLQKYPQLIFTGAKQHFLNTPVYFELSGTYDYLYRDEGEKGHYVELAPTVSLPLNIYNYLRLTPQVTLKETFWNRDDDETDSKGKTGDRTVINASVSLNSQMSRIYDTDILNWEKIRHEIKPEISYFYVPNVSRDDLPNYYSAAFSPFINPVSISSTDVLSEQNAMAWSLTNTLTARLKDEKGATSYLEFLRLKLYQLYDIHEARKDMTGVSEERKPFSDMGIDLDITPYKYLTFKLRNIYNFYDGWKQTNYDLNFKDQRGDSLFMGYRYTQDSLEEVSFDLQTVITQNIEGRFIWRRDLENSRLIENTVGFTYKKQCWQMGMDYTETYDDVRFVFKFLLTGFSNPGVK